MPSVINCGIKLGQELFNTPMCMCTCNDRFLVFVFKEKKSFKQLTGEPKVPSGSIFFAAHSRTYKAKEKWKS